MSEDFNNNLIISPEEQFTILQSCMIEEDSYCSTYRHTDRPTERGSEVYGYSDCEDDVTAQQWDYQVDWGRRSESRSPILVPDVTWSSSDSDEAGDNLTEPTVPSVIEEREEQTSPKYHSTNTGVTSFWRYRKIAKGPQGKQYKLNISAPKDPNMPIIYQDPAFTKDAAAHNLSHFGKARTGQATDMSPSPSKLIKLGEELQTAEEAMVKLGNSAKTKRQRIKISGKISRLRKVANLEANKIMLSGLQKQTEELTDTISEVTTAISRHIANSSLSLLVSDIVERGCKTHVAGMCGEYVDMVLSLERPSQ